MFNPNWSRAGIVAAAAIGCSLGAAGLVAADHRPGGDATAPPTSLVEITLVDTTLEDTSLVDTTLVDTTLEDTSLDTAAPAAPTTIDLAIPRDTIEDSSAPTTADDSTPDESAPTTADDSTSDGSAPTTADASNPDQSTPTTDDATPDDSTPDQRTPTSTPVTIDDSVPDTSTPPASLPQPFTETYSSRGGSITVAWSGTALSLVSVDPAAGYHAEIEDHGWDRVRVDFDGDDDHRIEIRLNDGAIRVRVD